MDAVVEEESKYEQSNVSQILTSVDAISSLDISQNKGTAQQGGNGAHASNQTIGISIYTT
jgi:hypothetical protein